MKAVLSSSFSMTVSLPGGEFNCNINNKQFGGKFNDAEIAMIAFRVGQKGEGIVTFDPPGDDVFARMKEVTDESEKKTRLIESLQAELEGAKELSGKAVEKQEATTRDLVATRGIVRQLQATVSDLQKKLHHAEAANVASEETQPATNDEAAPETNGAAVEGALAKDATSEQQQQPSSPVS